MGGRLSRRDKVTVLVEAWDCVAEIDAHLKSGERTATEIEMLLQSKSELTANIEWLLEEYPEIAAKARCLKKKVQ